MAAGTAEARAAVAAVVAVMGGAAWGAEAKAAATLDAVATAAAAVASEATVGPVVRPQAQSAVDWGTEVPAAMVAVEPVAPAMRAASRLLGKAYRCRTRRSGTADLYLLHCIPDCLE